MNKTILTLCLVLIALMGIASVSAGDADNCTLNEIEQHDVEEYLVDNSSADATPYDAEEFGDDNSSSNTTLHDAEENGVANSCEDDSFPYDLEQYCIDNCPADGITPYNIYEHIHFDGWDNLWVDRELYEFAIEVIWYFNEDSAVEILAHELGISEDEASWVYVMAIEYHHIVYNIPPPDEYDPSMYA